MLLVTQLDFQNFLGDHQSAINNLPAQLNRGVHIPGVQKSFDVEKKNNPRLLDSKKSQSYITAMTSPPWSLKPCHCSAPAVTPPKSLHSTMQ
jgi:hypothetical protein